jgi:hypothetical protein
MLNHITNHSANQLFGSNKLLMHKKKKKKKKKKKLQQQEQMKLLFLVLITWFSVSNKWKGIHTR